jgi:hypothetical protein
MNAIEKLLVENEDYASAKHLVDVEGMSTPRVCNLLNDLVGTLEPDEYYLEIGTWKGLTICSAAYENQGKKCIACDKFRIYGKWTGFGFMVKRALYSNLARYKDKSADVTFHHMPSTKLFERDLVPENVKVYFYDGDHSYEGTRHGVVAAAPKLSEESYLLMDDWNDEVIQKATYDGFEEAGLEILWMRELEGENRTQDGWWNGLGVFHLGKAS